MIHVIPVLFLECYYLLWLTLKSSPEYVLRQTVHVAEANVPWASTSLSGGIPATRTPKQKDKIWSNSSPTQRYLMDDPSPSPPPQILLLCNLLSIYLLRASGKRLTSLQPINILCVEAQKEPFVKQKSKKIMGIVWSVIARVQLLS